MCLALPTPSNPCMLACSVCYTQALLYTIPKHRFEELSAEFAYCNCCCIPLPTLRGCDPDDGHVHGWAEWVHERSCNNTHLHYLGNEDVYYCMSRCLGFKAQKTICYQRWWVAVFSHDYMTSGVDGEGLCLVICQAVHVSVTGPTMHG